MFPWLVFFRPGTIGNQSHLQTLPLHAAHEVQCHGPSFGASHCTKGTIIGERILNFKTRCLCKRRNKTRSSSSLRYKIMKHELYLINLSWERTWTLRWWLMHANQTEPMIPNDVWLPGGEPSRHRKIEISQCFWQFISNIIRWICRGTWEPEFRYSHVWSENPYKFHFCTFQCKYLGVWMNEWRIGWYIWPNINILLLDKWATPCKW